MGAPEIDVKPVMIGAGVVVFVVALAVASVFVLMTAWHEPLGGEPSDAAALVQALRERGPALQSAPQIDAASYRAQKAQELAASKAAR